MANEQKTTAIVVSDKNTLEALMKKEGIIQSLKDVLPKHLTPERVVKMALVAASRQPMLFKCTQASFLQSIMKSAELGLDCSGTLGRGYLVPYYNGKISSYECQFIPGYQGLIDLARRSGNIARIESRVVYEKDQFNVEYGLDQRLTHKPFLGGDRGKIQCVYAVAEMTDGSRQIEVMTIDEVDAIRERSKAKDAGPWKTDFSEMARKTVIRRIAKYLPLSTELAQALEVDDQQFIDSGVAAGMADGIKSSAEVGINGVKERLRKPVESQEAKKPDHDTAADQPEPAPARFYCRDCDSEFDNATDKGNCPKCGKNNLIDRQGQGQSGNEDVIPDSPTEFLYHCLKCGEGFDKPKTKSNGQTICPGCLSHEITVTDAAGAGSVK